MLKLYTAANSICTQKVFITLREKKLDYEMVIINLFANEQFQPSYLKINPKGVVPALDHNGSIIIESSLICEYLDEAFPEPRLTPPDPHARARMRLWSKAVDEGLFEATRELSFSAMFREKMRNMTEEQRQGRFHNVGDPVKGARLKSVYEDGADSPYVYQGIAAFETAFGKMEKDLSSDAPWLVGPTLTLADINMMPFVARLAYLDLLDIWIADRPRTQDWWSRVQQIESFQEAIPGKLTPSEIDAMATFGHRIRQQVRSQRTLYLQQPRAAA